MNNFSASQLNWDTIVTWQNLQVSILKENPKFLITSVAKAADLPSAVFVSVAGGEPNVASKSSAAGALI